MTLVGVVILVVTYLLDIHCGCLGNLEQGICTHVDLYVTITIQVAHGCSSIEVLTFCIGIGIHLEGVGTTAVVNTEFVLRDQFKIVENDWATNLIVTISLPILPITRGIAVIVHPCVVGTINHRIAFDNCRTVILEMTATLSF